MKTYVITGAASGIGNALMTALAKNNVIFAGYRNENNIDKLTSQGKNVIPFYMDYSKKQTISAAAAFIKSETSRIDTIINAAGCVIAGAVENLEIDDIRKQFDVNTFGHLDFSQRLLCLLEEGKIINISSMASFGLFPFIAPYCASKRALDILFNCMLLESKKNIKIISVKPGVVATPLWEKSIELNKAQILNCKDYEKEMKYLVSNARSNSTKGLNVSKITDLVLKIDEMKNPKSSYTIGIDAMCAEIISRLPHEWVNKLVKAGMKNRIG